ncbi:bifunctional uroporphyrinogen-III C-methyltransferase/uroporphyrinogen-III synthase [Corynebacterium sp. CCM 8835]|uniref:Uroporphyrinogen-III synthase n=1 Tax=Corynebacterium antarcticum TaxID=2800405 RepID=A0A9Q4CEA3_9CORY|nr:bifunctional uroporphyrinogen-III C-methyltransferase/uroporphyrinogen-III synthase [Corynebacterium antarcticum]MCK7642439.1 bifunctional uroporphyrinogen-III C-methyltransferase/uroporphyrinogen-III synthase [Corynebacterium antarcticum]MCK7660876.1 bifunctional uroporphyrinogen-III C-methyltransferase/uroporphyrinogen-III synthase [Corynebacterium antarcticum]MCL0245623.1 bifunctional uroporphyrinogen-III C-methyltransferase/uroporphyrinogen-III synthase [Corynebacterium antarcticum]MCX74
MSMAHPAPEAQEPTTGNVIFVGAGPGNPDLLTVRAREVLSHTAIALTDPGVLGGVREIVASELAVPQAKLDAADEAYARQCAEAKAAGARRKPPRPPAPTAAEITEITDVTPEEVAKLLAEGVADGSDVIRLVAGNPLTSDSVLAEINAVAAAGLEFQVVPGMSVPSTVPAFAGIALGSTYTETDITRGDDVDWGQLATAPQPLVLQATREQLVTIAEKLLGCGMSPQTPVSVTVHGTTRLQRTHDTTLSTLGKLDGELPGQLVVSLGTSVDDRSKYSWWENRPLYGWRVLVPRAKEQAAPMSTRLASHGAIPQEVPTISVEPPRNPAQMERAVKGIVEGRYQWVVLTSVNAVKALWSKMADFGLDARSFAGVRIAAVGHKTAAAIRDLGITPELTPRSNNQNAIGLVEVFPEYDSDLDPVGRVLLPRADIATETLVEGLVDLGWEVDDIVAYRTVRAAPPSAEIREMIKSGGFDAVCFTSSSTVRNLVGIAGKPHQRTIIACIGPMAAATAAEMGLRVDVQPEVAGVAELVDALAAHVAALRAAGQLPPPRKKRRSRRTNS